jgi:hypothetical protein
MSERFRVGQRVRLKKTLVTAPPRNSVPDHPGVKRQAGLATSMLFFGNFQGMMWGRVILTPSERGPARREGVEADARPSGDGRGCCSPACLSSLLPGTHSRAASSGLPVRPSAISRSKALEEGAAA